jgi:hypothetical protein
MDNDLNTYGHGGANSESYHESEGWEFPLSSSLPEMENIRSGQVSLLLFVNLQCGRALLTGFSVLLPAKCCSSIKP